MVANLTRWRGARGVEGDIVNCHRFWGERVKALSLLGLPVQRMAASLCPLRLPPAPRLPGYLDLL